MSKLVHLLFLSVIVLFSASSVAGESPKMAYIESLKSDDGRYYRHYMVTCRNDARLIVTSWRRGRRWCVGDHSETYCSNSRLKAAERACRLTYEVQMYSWDEELKNAVDDSLAAN